MLYQIWFYVPTESKEIVKSAIFNTGAGKIGNYDSCCFETQGTGQFRPLEGANPSKGSLNQIEYVQEVKIEFVCDEDNLKETISTLKQAHPYEEVAYGVVKLENL